MTKKEKKEEKQENWREKDTPKFNTHTKKENRPKYRPVYIRNGYNPH